MFGFRTLKRSKQTVLRLFLVFVSFCVILMFINSMKTLPDNIHSELKTVSSLGTAENVAKEGYVFTKANIGEIASHFNLPVQPQNQARAAENLMQKNYEKSKQVNLDKMREKIKRLNQEQNILNKEKFPLRNSDSIVIVIQVHTRAKYLIKLIQSLKNARGISDALLIFSHDYFASDINSLVSGIDFCQVLQIFFPQSEQLYPDEFPGTDPEDCPRNTPKHKAIALGCKNAEHPDMYEHYREAKFTMTKHHWWWKANRIFHDLRSTKNHQGLVLFLEEDHYVSPDFYEVIQKAYTLKKTSTECQEYGCDIITLGDYKKISNYEEVRSNVVQVKPWKSTENNMGMAFGRDTWNKVIKCHTLFCTYDDYNWDWTLMKMSLFCLRKPLTVLLFKAPRVFHLGTCGLHHKTGNCNVETVLSGVRDIIDSNEKLLYPQELDIDVAKPWIQGSVSQPNGGWGDTRDHKLCMQFAKSTEK